MLDSTSDTGVNLRARIAGGLALGLVVGAAVAATQFPAAGNDDSHITYWSAHALAKYGAVLNYNGEHVEQSSSLLFVCLLAALHKIFALPIPATAWVVSILAAAGAVVVATKLTFGIERRAAPFTAVLAATALPFAYWATSGMETTLVALLGCAVIEVSGEGIDAGRLRFDRHGALELALLVAFALVRPETPVVLLCTLGGTSAFYAYSALVRHDASAKPRLTATLVRFGAALAVVLVVVLGRYAAFHAFVPNSAAAKVGGFELGAGAKYLWKTCEKMDYASAIIWLGGVVFCVRQLRAGQASSRAPLLLAWILAMLSFVLASGGDWMPAGRLVAPTVPALSVLGAVFVGPLIASPTTTRGRPWLTGWIVLFLGVWWNVRSELRFGGSHDNGSFNGDAASAGE